MIDKNISNSLKIIVVMAIGLTCLGYWIDSDPAYDNPWHTVLEFSIISFVLFGLFSLVFLTLYYIAKKMRK